MDLFDFVTISESNAVLPVPPQDPNAPAIWSEKVEDEWRDYEGAGGVEYIGYGDDTNYNGNYGDYLNEFDYFESGDGLPWYYEHHDEAADLSQPHWVYSQSSGNLLFVNEKGEVSQISVGYSGSQLYQNNPDAQHIKNNGPIPRGEYQITLVDNHKGPYSIALSPQDDNEMFDRSSFMIHGDNSKGDKSASQGCIILDRATRERITESGVETLVVTG
jgi:hypothetical protein